VFISVWGVRPFIYGQRCFRHQVHTIYLILYLRDQDVTYFQHPHSFQLYSHLPLTLYCYWMQKKISHKLSIYHLILSTHPYSFLYILSLFHSLISQLSLFKFVISRLRFLCPISFSHAINISFSCYLIISLSHSFTVLISPYLTLSLIIISIDHSLYLQQHHTYK
jgi:hypothetical protein